MDEKVWLITGASRGLGIEFVKAALDRGQRVAATARNPLTITQALGKHENLLPLALDVTDQHSIKCAVDAAADHFGGIDILVNNAGYGIFGALEETSDADTRAIYETNVFGPMNVIRAVLPLMRAQKSGRIVNMSSMAGYATDPGGSLYDSTKFALIGLTEVLSQELAPFGIQCMAVCPGMIRTDFFDGTSLKEPSGLMTEYADNPSRGALDYCLAHNHLQYGDPEKVARFVCDIALSDSMPLWLPVGKDAMKKLFAKCERMTSVVEPYYEGACDTSYPRS